MANLKILNFPRKVLNKAMNIRARQLDQKQSLKNNVAVDFIQDECISTIKQLANSIVENPKELAAQKAYDILDTLKIYENKELLEDLLRLKILEHNKVIGNEAKDAAGIAEQEMYEAATR